jgi:HlyD family secretion protein
MSIFRKAPGWLSKLKEMPLISMINKRKGWAITAIALLLVSAGGYAYYKLVYVPSQTVATSTLQTSVARQGDLVIYVSGTGTLAALNQVDLGFTTSGQVKEVNVKVVDHVNAGDLLAQLDDTDAQIKYTQAQRALAELTSPSAIASAQTGIATAQQDVDSALGHLEYIISPVVLHWELEIEKTKKTIDEINSQLTASPSDVDLKAKLEKAEAYLDYAQDRLKDGWYYYDNDYAKQNFTVGRGSTRYVMAPTAADMLEARAAVTGARASLVEAQNLYYVLTGDEIPADATGAGLTALEQAKLDLESAQNAVDGTRIYSPISGTVMSVDVAVGDSVASSSSSTSSTSPVITVADMSQLYLETYFDETDWAQLAVGYEAEIVFDALPDDTFIGKVTQVDPTLYASGNTSVIRGLVLLEDASKVNLPLGTSAAVDVISGQAKNAVLIPVDALHKAGDQYGVFVQADGKIRLRMVEVGIQDLLSVEIKSGLEPGEVVTTGITETQ